MKGTLYFPDKINKILVLRVDKFINYNKFAVVIDQIFITGSIFSESSQNNVAIFLLTCF